MTRSMNQVTEAVTFHDQNCAEVKRVEVLVLAAAKRFLDGSDAKAVLPEQVIAEAQAAVGRTNVFDYFSVIRPYAALFVAARSSLSFWAVIDSCNFFRDATSSGWRYMTQERRRQNLAWAAEEAALV